MRAGATTPLAEARGKELEVVRIGLLGGFSVTVGERKFDESAWRLRKAASLIKLLALEHRGEINPSVSDLEWSAPVRPLERFGHSSVEVLNERQDLLAEILYRDEVAPL
jgi:hypothetical protein